MARLRIFLKRHILLVGLLAVVAPLVIILRLQYNSLTELERTSAADHKMTVKTSLEAVANEIKWFYQNSAEQRLNVSPHALDGDSLCPSTYVGKSLAAGGAKRLFVADFSKKGRPVVYLTNGSNKMERAANDSDESRAVNVACAPWKFLAAEGTTIESKTLTVDERDPENRILLKPIIDRASKVLGVAGMIVDNQHFKEHVLPKAIDKYFPRRLIEDRHKGVILTVHDRANNVLLSTGPASEHPEEMSLPLQFIFKDWQLSIHNRDLTPEQLAHQNFAINMSMSVTMMLVLVAGVFLALKAAAREMKLSEMKTDFVSNVSHELRTPLSSIRVFGEFLTLGRVREPEKIREYGRYIENESRRLTQLINNILDFSKIETAQKNYQFEKADVAEVIQSTLRMFEVRLRQNDFAVIFEPPQPPLPRVRIDQDAIAQAFVNLVDNAVKYSGTAKEISVQLGERDGFVTIAVTDYGIGIPRADQEKIFEKFYRVSTGLVHDVKGNGLGLSIVKHIVEAHQGKLEVESQPGQGSTFTIYLPVDEGLRSSATTEDTRLRLGVIER